VDLKSTFVKRFGDLVALLRADPGTTPRKIWRSPLLSPRREYPLEVEAGVEWSVIPDDLTLKGRLLARSVDHVRIAAERSRASCSPGPRLAHDVTPIPSTADIEVKLIPPLLSLPPGVRWGGSGAERRAFESPAGSLRGATPLEERRHSARARWTATSGGWVGTGG